MSGSAEPRPANCAPIECVKSLSSSSTVPLPGIGLDSGDLIDGRWNTPLAEHRGEYAAAIQLAIDQDTVTIENH